MTDENNNTDKISAAAGDEKYQVNDMTSTLRPSRKPSLEVAPTTLAWRTRRTTKNTSLRNVHPQMKKTFWSCDHKLSPVTLTYKTDLNIAKMSKVDIIRPYFPSRRLHSSNKNLLHKDRTNLVIANHAFSQSTPAVWNSLLQNVISDLSKFSNF